MQSCLEIQPSVLYFGTPVVLLSTLNMDGSTNLSPLSSAWALGDRVVLGIGKTGQAYANLLRCADCVINLPGPELWPQVESMARGTGVRDVPPAKQAMGYVHMPDKFASAGLTRQASQTVQPDRVAECPLQIEARMTKMHEPAPAADAAAAFVIVETSVCCVHAHTHIVRPGTQHIDTTRWAPLLYVFRHYMAAHGPLGANFRAEISLAASIQSAASAKRGAPGNSRRTSQSRWKTLRP